jgi:hypothetical protein
MKRAERRAAPKPARIPPGEHRPRLRADLRRLGRPERLPRLAAGRLLYSADEGLS